MFNRTVLIERYIGNNSEFIPNFGERRRQGATISTAFVECGVDDQPSCQPTIREEAANAVDPTRGPPLVANQDEGPQS
jgi:hypothetical protein